MKRRIAQALIIGSLATTALVTPASAGLVVGLATPPGPIAADDPPLPVLDLEDPYVGRADDERIRVQFLSHQDAANRDVSLGI